MNEVNYPPAAPSADYTQPQPKKRDKDLEAFAIVLDAIKTRREELIETNETFPGFIPRRDSAIFSLYDLQDVFAKLSKVPNSRTLVASQVVEFTERFRALTIYVERSNGKPGAPDFVLEQLRNACERSIHKISATIAILLDDDRPTWREELRDVLTDAAERLTSLI